MAKRKVTSYSLEFKQSSAQLAASSEQPLAQTAKELGVNVNTLYGWIKKYGRSRAHKPSEAVSLEQELVQLKKENARLKQERDILKKAAACVL